MEDHLSNVPTMPSSSPTESTGSGGSDDSRGGKSPGTCQLLLFMDFITPLINSMSLNVLLVLVICFNC